MDPISSVSHMILTRVSTPISACRNLCYTCMYMRKRKTLGGLNPGPLTLHAVVLPLSYWGEIHVSGQFALFKVLTKVLEGLKSIFQILRPLKVLILDIFLI